MFKYFGSTIFYHYEDKEMYIADIFATPKNRYFLVNYGTENAGECKSTTIGKRYNYNFYDVMQFIKAELCGR